MRRCLLLVLIAASLVPAQAAWADTQKHVLVLYATRRESQIAVLGDRELPRILEGALSNRIDYYSEHLDLARFPEVGYQAAVGDFLAAKYADQCFDVVIAMHEVALEFAVANRSRLFADAPIVFFSNLPNTTRPPNSTGIVSGHNFAATLDLAATLQPATRQVFVVSGADVRDREFEKLARAQLQRFSGQFAITYLSGLPTEELKRRLASLPPTAIVYYLVVNRDGAGANFQPLQYMEEVVRVANVPVYGWVDSMVGRGIVGGTMKSQMQQVTLIGELAGRVLAGEPADRIPMPSADLLVSQVDWRQLRHWNIPETRLPAGAMLLFEERSTWERYRGYILAALIALSAQTALIAGLLLQRSRRRKAEAQVRGGEVQLRDSYDRIRALGARLLHAQDTERARIARELHDDISQQVALLSIDLELLRGRTSRASDELTGQALDRVHGISRSVHDLAHRLYPAKLRLIGLVPALLALQREMERSEIVVNFVYEDVPPALSPDLTLCLFRVVQEALQNAVKYSHAREVTLRLIGSADELSLTVADDGVGFDVESAWGTGLGLVSMRERLDAIGGQLMIRSKAGAGTRLDVIAPLREERPSEAAMSGAAAAWRA